VQVAPERDGQRIAARVLGDARLPAGARVALTIRDPVLVWPAKAR
jgi:hypothetical protein